MYRKEWSLVDRSKDCEVTWLFLRIIHLLAHELRHGEHVHLVLPKHFSHRAVAQDISLVSRILEIVAFDMLPQSFGDFGTR